MSTDLQVFDDPYDPAIQDFQTKSLPLDQLVELGMRKLSLELNVWRPAKVINKKGNGRVDVQILLQSRYINQTKPFTLPAIQDCLVGHLRGENYYIKPPIKVGDTGIALFCDRSLDAWSVQGGTVYDPDPRLHSLSDCVFIPGLYPFNAQVMDDTDDLVICNGDSKIRVQADGKFQIKNKNQELIDIIDQLLIGLQTKTFTMTFDGPEPFIEYTQEFLLDLQQKLETLKGSS